MKLKNKLFCALLCSLTALFMIACSNGSSDEGGLVGEPELISSISYDELITELTKAAGETNEDSDTFNSLIEKLNAQRDEINANIQTEILNDLDNINAYVKSVDPDASDITESDVTGQNGVGDIHVETYKLTCKTRSMNGEWINVSGTVSLSCISIGFLSGLTQKFSAALHYSTAKNIVLHNHVTITSNKECPTNASLTKTDSFLVRALAFNDYFVVSPDYEGYGDTKDRVHTYLIQDDTARQCVDFLREAIKWKNSKSKVYGTYGGLAENFGTYSIGYSQGGSVALAVHRHIENWNLTDELHFHGSYCGDGPYSPPETYKWYIKKNEVYMPVAVALILRSYLPHYGDSILKGYNIDTYFSETFQNALAGSSVKGILRNTWYAIDGKDKDTTEINKLVFSWFGGDAGAARRGYCTAEELFKPDARAENFDSAPAQALLTALEKNDLTKPSNWKNGKGPVKRAVIMHSYTDEVVPYVNMWALKNLSGNLKYYVPNGEDPSRETELKYIDHNCKVTKGRHEGFGTTFFAWYILAAKDFKEKIDATD
ncbi:hypothetical protein MSI_15150 [Treponema sp. JC4]|uniref:hypothetical protein n=1 Tax=Treponema sp. JC4 TaxID=1124982 RepID=UPI00025B073B|nr:hypothetical protein [Treponema sp. JC4]EID85028.1 hypothetical protein MSI_15150 [Treponema sp. JC4]